MLRRERERKGDTVAEGGIRDSQMGGLETQLPNSNQIDATVTLPPPSTTIAIAKGGGLVMQFRRCAYKNVNNTNTTGTRGLNKIKYKKKNERERESRGCHYEEKEEEQTARTRTERREVMEVYTSRVQN